MFLLINPRIIFFSPNYLSRLFHLNIILTMITRIIFLPPNSILYLLYFAWALKPFELVIIRRFSNIVEFTSKLCQLKSPIPIRLYQFINLITSSWSELSKSNHIRHTNARVWETIGGGLRDREKKIGEGEKVEKGRERERESHILVGLERSIEAIVRGEIVIVVSTPRGWSGRLIHSLQAIA